MLSPRLVWPSFQKDQCTQGPLLLPNPAVSCRTAFQSNCLKTIENLIGPEAFKTLQRLVQQLEIF